ncbi:MAG: PspC domain-containing protein [Thermoleophilaceae bacterium]
MSAVPTSAPARPPLRRDCSRRVIAGVCAGAARNLGIDALFLRVAFLVATMAGGIGIPLYGIAWAVIPRDETEDGPAAARFGGRPGSKRIAAGVALLVLGVVLVMRQLGVWFSDELVWPLVLALAGGALIWRQSAGREQDEPGPAAPPAAALSAASAAPAGGQAGAAAAPAGAVEAARGRGSAHIAARVAPHGLPVPSARSAARAAGGALLVVAGGGLFLAVNQISNDVGLTVLVVFVCAFVILAPWWLRLVRNLSAERSERIRSQERAEVAAHLHDSVLQTLALVQRRAGDPRAVAGLARRQERELRAWLSGRPAPGPGASLTAALEHAAAEVEEAHGTTIDVVAVGDCPLDQRTEAVVAAAREALVNAAKFAGQVPVSVYAEVADGRVQVFVRDRGPGFDPAAIPADRRGVRESIVGRMERHGGHAEIRTDAGTEVELTVERER